MKGRPTTVDQESHHQPILLTRSDTFQPYHAISSPPMPTATITAPSDENDPEDGDNDASSRQEKRKWDQVADDSSQTNVCKMQEQSNQPLHLTNEDEEVSQDSDDPHGSPNGKRLGRKPMPDEDHSDDGDPKVKRKAQNRAAQRAFRDRKERYVKELELKLKQVQDTHVMATNHLFQENHQLRSIIYRLETENVALKGIHIQHGPLSGKPAQQWMEALQEHQQRFANTSLSLATIGSAFAQPGILPSPSSLANLAPAPTMPNPLSMPATSNQSTSFTQTPSTSPVTTAATTSQSRQQQNHIQYTFSISTPATLRSRHKQQQQQQQQQNRSSLSPQTGSKQQRSPVELVRLYPHEHSSMALMVPDLPTTSNAHHIPQSPASTISASTHGSLSAAPTPTLECQAFCDKLQEEVCTNAFDQLLSEPLFDTATGGLNTSLGFSHLDEEHPLVYTHHDQQQLDQQPLSPSSCGTTADDTEKSTSAGHLDSTCTNFLSGQEIYDRLHQHSRFEQYSSDQLLAMVKSMAKCTHLGPVVTEQDIKIVLAKMDQGRV